MNVIQRLVMLLNPRGLYCAGCGRPVKRGSGGICEKCAKKLVFMGKRRALEGVERVFSPIAYTGIMRDMIINYKYNNRRYIARFLAVCVAYELKGVPKDSVLLPVPLHPNRLKSRGFCQTTELCRELSEMTGIPCDASILSRVRDTPRQAMCSRKQRPANVKGAFAAKGVKKGGTYIIVDDVLTTGATALECVRTLKEAGAGRLFFASPTATGKKSIK